MKTVNKMILACIIIGTAVLITGFSLGGYQQMSDIFEKEGNYWGWRTFAVSDFDKEFSDIDNVSLEIDASNVTIEEYEGSTIRVEAKNVNKKTEIINKNGTLVIDDKDGIWGLGIGLFNSNGKITIYVPKGKEFINVDIDVDAGSVNLETLVTKYLEVQVNAGSVKGQSIVCTSGDFDVDAGKMDFDTLDGQSLKFNVDAGKIAASLVGSEQEYRYQAKCDVGTVRIGSYKASGINSKDSGGTGLRTIEAECDVGKIDIRMEW